MINASLFRIIGVAFWIGAGAAGLSLSRQPQTGTQPGESASLLDYFSGPSEQPTYIDPTQSLAAGDPVFFQSAEGDWSQIGYVATTSQAVQAEGDADPGCDVVLAWHARQVRPEDCRLIQYRNSGRLEDVVATMLPEQKRRVIQDRIRAAMQRHGEELAEAFTPLVRSTMRESIPIIEQEFRAATQRHRDRINELAGRWDDEIVSQRLMPLARREIMPIVRRHGQPPAEEIGRELWDRASIWRFAWRAVYDKSPLPRKDLVQEEWDRFVEEEAVPVFERRMDDIVVAVQRVVADVAANGAVRGELADVADAIASDEQTQLLVRDLLNESIIENERLRVTWDEIWSSEEARRALDLAGDRLEPVVRQIGDDLFGNEKVGIDPDFARVLRNQILRKDRRWIVAVPAATPTSASTVISLSGDSMPYPIVYLADRESD